MSKKIIALVFVLCLILTSCSTLTTDQYIFSDIEECYGFELGDVQITTLNCSEDKHLKALKFDRSYCAKYVSQELEFVIFAYEFTDETTAKKYFKNATGKRSETDRNFSTSSGMISYEANVIDGKNAYTVQTKNEYIKPLEMLLSKHFTVRVYEWNESGNDTDSSQMAAIKDYYTLEDFDFVEIGKTTIKDMPNTNGDSIRAASYGGYCDYPTRPGGYIRVKIYGPDFVVGDIEEFYPEWLENE